MPATRFQPTSAVRETAVSETVKRVNAEALDLLTRRAEINQRIRCLHQVMKALRDMATNATFNICERGRPEPAFDRTGPANLSTPRRRLVGQRRSCISDRPEHLPAGLTRACRIALMEAGGTASPEEIRASIVRRGSFSFADSGFPDTEIMRTLTVMTERGEVRRLETGSRSVWQRIAPAPKNDSAK